MRRVLIGLVGAAAGAVAGVALGAGGVLLVRAVGSDSSSWADLGIAAVALVVVAPLLAVVGTVVALRMATGRAIARPAAMTVAVAGVFSIAGALFGTGAIRFTLAVLGSAFGLIVAGALDRTPSTS